MSVVKTIRCDECGVCAHDHVSFYTDMSANLPDTLELRLLLMKHGWSSKGNKDLCPTCAAKRKKSKP